MVASVSLIHKKDEKFGYSFLVARDKERPIKTVMVFIHGASGYAEYFSAAMRFFAQMGFIAVAPDIAGHGERADVDIRSASVLDYVADMRNFIERIVRVQYPGYKLVLVGHSMGGLIVQKLVESGLGDAAILITPAPPKGVAYLPGKLLLPALSDIAGTLMLLLARKPFKPSRKLISKFFADPIASKEMIDKWCAMRVSGESLVALRELGSSAVAVDRHRVNIPMLVIGGAEDAIIHKSVAKNIAAFYGADHEELQLLGHMCIWEAGWERTARAMERWLKQRFKYK